MCDQKSLRPACAYTQTDERLYLSFKYFISVKLFTKHYLEFLSLTGGTAAKAGLSLHLSKCHIVGNHTSWLKCILFIAVSLFCLVLMNKHEVTCLINRGSYMSAHVLFNLLNELVKRDKMRGLPKYHFCPKNVIILSLCTQRCYGRHTVSRKSILLHSVISLPDATSYDKPKSTFSCAYLCCWFCCCFRNALCVSTIAT